MDTNRLVDDVAREMTGTPVAQPLRGPVLERLDRRPPVMWRLTALRTALALSAATIVVAAGWRTSPRHGAVVPRPAMHVSDARPVEGPAAAHESAATALAPAGAPADAATTPIDIGLMADPTPIRLTNIQPAPMQIPLLQLNAIAIDPLLLTPLAASQSDGPS